jgi:hypothetical protein
MEKVMIQYSYDFLMIVLNYWHFGTTFFEKENENKGYGRRQVSLCQIVGWLVIGWMV